MTRTGHEKTTGAITTRASIATGALALAFLLAPQALAAPPIHARDAALDVSGLDHACGTAVDSEGDLYASSAGESKIEVYAPADHSTPIATIADAHEPCALAVDGHGDLLVSERATGNVVLYAPDSYPLSGSPTYGSAVTIDASGEAQGISIDPFDERLYVAEGDHVSTYGSETQQLKVANATGGSFKLRFEGEETASLPEETASLPFNASAEEIEGALEALGAIGAGGSLVTTTSATQKRISFASSVAYRDVPQLELSSSLQGNETQKITVKATTGSFKLRFEGLETAPINFEASALELKEALEALSNIGSGDVSVSGGPGDKEGTHPYFVTFEGALGNRNVGPIERDQSGLGGGTVAVTTNGGGTHEGVEGFATTARSGGGTDEVQKVKVLNATGGTFKLSFEGEETDPIFFNASTKEARKALEKLPSIGAGNVSVVFEFSPIYLERRYTIEFQGTLARTDVPQLTATSSLVGSSPSIATQTSTPGFSGAIGADDELAQATAVAAYTYEDFSESDDHRLYVAVADAEGDVLKTFSGAGISSLKLRRTIKGVDEDGNGAVSGEEEFDFGAAGAYLTADPGNANPASPFDCLRSDEQVCTAGHLFLYDAGHNAVDELDATGHFLDRISAAGLEDGEPTQVAVDRSGSEADGTLYVSSGSSSSAGVLAFKPLLQPHREALGEPLSRVLANAQSVATDDHGDIYVGAGSTVHVYSPGPASKELTSFSVSSGPLDLAVDSKGNVYVVEGTGKLFYYDPSKYPPDATTVYPKSSELASTGLRGAAIDPADDSLYVYKYDEAKSSGVVLVFKAAAEGSALKETCGGGLGLEGLEGWDVDVDGATGEVFLGAGVKGITAIRCGAGTETIRQIKGNGCPSGKFGTQPSLAIDQANGHLVAFQPGQAGGAREYEASGACVAQFGTFSSQSTPQYRVAVDNSCALQKPPLSGTACEAFDPSYGNVYAAYDALNNTAQPYDVNAFGPLEYPAVGDPPTVKSLLADGFGLGEATLRGTVNPNGSEVESCTFEYLTEAEYEGNGETFSGAEEEECAESPEEIGGGTEPVPVHVTLKSLVAGIAYCFHALASNVNGAGEGEAECFGPPRASAQQALPVGYDEATLRGTVDPANVPTTYRFEYLTQAEYEAGGGSFAGAKSTPKGEIPAGEGAVAVQAPLTGLAEATSYRFRLVAKNPIGGEDVDEGPAFETLERPAPQKCANAEYRTGLSTFLPDCRAYELVTPAETRGKLNAFDAGSGEEFFNSWFVTPRGEGAGESLAYFGEVPRAKESTGAFHATRGKGEHPQAGWGNELYSLTFAQASRGAGLSNGVSADQRFWFFHVSGSKVPTEGAFPQGSFLRVPAGQANHSCGPEGEEEEFAKADPEAKFELIGCGELGTDLQAKGRFVSAGGSHVIFTSKAHLTNDAPPVGTEAIYDRGAGSTSATLISTKPDGTPVEAGENLTYVAATEDGKTVVFKASGNLYVHREGETVEAAEGPATYAGVSDEGTRLFYIDKAYSASGTAPVPTAGLRACDIGTGSCAGAKKTHDPIAIAEESIFVNVSADGSHAFFLTKEGSEANLYAWDGEGVSFVATLDPQDLISFRFGEGEDFEVQLEDLLQWTNAIPGQSGSGDLNRVGRAFSPTRSTPNGKVLVFQSHAKLTDYDNEGRGEIYRYASAAPSGERLICVSCDPSGAPPSYPFDTFLQPFEGPQGGFTLADTLVANVTDDGREVFFQTDTPLLPSDANQATDVYEWKARGTVGPGGDACERAGGCLALISSGQGEEPSVLYGMSADGHDVFLETQETLVGADAAETFSIYDARVGGGIPERPAAAPCQGDACQGQGTVPPALAVPGEESTPESPPAGPRCAKGKHRVKGRCVKTRHRKKRHGGRHAKKHQADHKGRTHR